MTLIHYQPVRPIPLAATLLAALLLPACARAGAQAMSQPKSSSPQSAPAQPSPQPPSLEEQMKNFKPITPENLTDRAYNSVWPKPSFPSNDREKKLFTVEYVYRYAQSDYTPAVPIPQITHAQTQTDTPEHTFIAFISALKSLDYDWWLSLWDVRSQQMFRDDATSKKQDAAYWKAQWQHQFAGLPVTLYSRLETLQNILLEYRIGLQQSGEPTPLYPAPMRYENGKWLLTRELSEVTFVPFLGQQTISGNIDLVPTSAYSGRPVPPVATHTQELFLRNQGLGTSSATDFVW